MKQTFSEKLKKLTRRIKEAQPGISWREAADEARSQLYANNVFPSYNAGVKEFWWKNHKDTAEVPTPGTDEAATATPPTSPIASAEQPPHKESVRPPAVDSVAQLNIDGPGLESDGNADHE